MSPFFRLVCLLCTALSLTACAPMLALVGTNQTLVQIVAQVERVKLAGDGVSYVGSGKTVTDHALSIVSGKDCKIFNVVSPDPVCASKTANANVKLSLGPEIESLPQPAAQTTSETDTANAAPAPAQAAGDD